MSTKYNNEISLGGQTFQLLKSALQKCFRLGDYWGAFRSIAIMEGFHRFESGFQSRIRTNLLNRIRVCYLEDISVANLCGLEWVHRLCEEIKSKEPNPVIIFHMVMKLCLSTKIRFPSYVRHAILSGKDGNELLSLCKSVLNGDETIMEKVKWGGSEILKSWWFDKKVIKGRERFLLIFHAIFLHLNIGNEECIDEKNSNHEEIVKEWKTYLNGKKMKIPIHAFDIHVSRMKNIDKSQSNFALCSSCVDNEMELSWMEEFKVSKLEYIYSKIQKDTENNYKFLDEEDAYNLIARVQLTTSESKNDVYIAENKINEQRVIVKGPYLNYFEAYKIFMIMRKVARDFNIKVPLPFIRILKCDSLFFGTPIPLGIRRRIKKKRLVCFLEWDDLFEDEVLEFETKSSKLWENEKILKRDSGLKTIMNKTLNKKLFINLIKALLVRQILHLGDFASRNFIVKEDDVFLIDFDRTNVSGIERAKFEKKFMNLIQKNSEKYKNEVEHEIIEIKKRAVDWIEESVLIERIGKFKEFLGLNS